MHELYYFSNITNVFSSQKYFNQDSFSEIMLSPTGVDSRLIDEFVRDFHKELGAQCYLDGSQWGADKKSINDYYFTE